MTSMVRAVITLWVSILRSCAGFFRRRQDQAIVELALRQQLAIYARHQKRPRIASLDRAFWAALSRIWPRWKSVLVIVQPDTVVRWQKRRFRAYWRSVSTPGPGRPPISKEIQALILRMATENRWRAWKIRAELGKLGIWVGLSTISRYLPKATPDPGNQQRWTTFLRNHRDLIAGMDFFVVPTVRFQLLYRFLILDNDAIFSTRVAASISSLGLEPKRTAFQSPWQNGTAERFVGSVRRELLDQVVVLGEDHLRRLLREYVDYYNAERVHTSIGDAPEGRESETRPSPRAKIAALPRVGGLHHRYTWREAA